MKHEVLPAVAVSRETRERLDLYLSLIRRWSGTVNLVSRGDLAHLSARHLEDALQVLPLLPDDPVPWLDLGSGAGIPGLVLAIASGHPVHLVEADRRKAAFLREAARACGVDAVVLATRIETIRMECPARLITARALAPLDRLLELAAPLLGSEGCCLFHKGREAAAELTHAAARWHMQLRRWHSRTDPSGMILQISAPTRRDAST